MSLNHLPRAISQWNLWPSVITALGGALAGAVVLGIAGGILAAMTGFDEIASIFFIGVLVPVGAMGGFAYALLAAVRNQMLENQRQWLPEHTRQPVTEADQTPITPPGPEPEHPPITEEPASPSPSPAPAASEIPPPAPRYSAPRKPSAFETQTSWLLQKVRAWFRRGNPLARAGIVILFIGGAFLAKYAAERGVLPLEVRLAAIAAGAITLLGLGWWLRHRRRGYALILQGGGIALFYLTIYASLRLYELMPPAIALVLMAVISLAAAILAVAQNSLVLAVIGFAGGFIAPLLASSGSGNHIALFSYYTVLNLGVFTVAWFRAWRVLNLVGFVFTFGVSALWRGYGYSEAQWLSTDAFLLLFFILYVACSILFALRQPPKLKGYVSGTLVFGLPVIVFALHASMVSHIEYALAWSALGFGVFYLLLAGVLFFTHHAHLRLLAEAFAALGVIFGSLAVPLAFGPEASAAIWAVEGAGLLWLGIRQNRKLARAFGALLQLAAGGQYLLGLVGLSAGTPIFNGYFMAAAGLAIAGFLSSLWFERVGNRRAAYEAPACWIFLLWALGWWLAGGLSEIERFAPSALNYGLGLIFLAATAVLLEWLGRRLKWTAGTQLAPFYAALMLAESTNMLFNLNHPLGHGAWFGWPLLWLAFYWLLWRRDRHRDENLPNATGWLHALGLWTLVLITTLEAQWQIARQTGGVWLWLAWGIIPAALAWLCARTTGIWPLSRHRDHYRFRGALPLVVVAAGWIFLVNLNSDGDPGVLPYLPLLNPLDVAVMLVFLALTGWWMALSDQQRSTLNSMHPALIPGLAAGLVFVWLNAALIRALHYLAGTPLDFDGVMASVTVQMALSIFWALLGFAAMVWASRRSRRIAWMAGAGLMVVVIVKLFLVDLAGTETLARVVSFLSVGALLLITGYFSPLPPRGPMGAEVKSS